MRQILTFLLLLSVLGFYSRPAFAQDGKAASDKVALALGRADATALGPLLAERLDLELPGKEGIYSRTQASIILRDFFREHPVSGFSLRHSGNSGEGATYAIGSYATPARSFRVYYLMKRSGGAFLVHQLRFEPEN
ncbi:MAG TPA: DUF4783 domain-containing protein [Bacteroidales bacterium]|nr:DUF4783 domain-containing protein [Bacteroidales bacterium]HRZ78260.1 DUF4783 domain-containing protein [Bacteroidales bacterium]